MTIGALGECVEICGKGKKIGLIECDDGNTMNGDGCSSMCTIEYGWICYNGSSLYPDNCTYSKTYL